MEISITLDRRKLISCDSIIEAICEVFVDNNCFVALHFMLGVLWNNVTPLPARYAVCNSSVCYTTPSCRIMALPALRTLLLFVPYTSPLQYSVILPSLHALSLSATTLCALYLSVTTFRDHTFTPL